jgi:hypothetical protein
MTEHILGRGVLTWSNLERVTDRYGTVCLRCHPRHHAPFVELAAPAHEGITGVLIARVIEARKTNHPGDVIRKIYPAMPAAGEDIILGSGELARHVADPAHVIGLIPSDGRGTDWLDPVQLFRAIDQTVDLVFRPGCIRRFPARLIPELTLGEITEMIPVGIEHEIRRPGVN